MRILLYYAFWETSICFLLLPVLEMINSLKISLFPVLVLQVKTHYSTDQIKCARVHMYVHAYVYLSINLYENINMLFEKKYFFLFVSSRLELFNSMKTW